MEEQAGGIKKKHLVEEETRRRLESRVEKTNRGGIMWGCEGETESE